MTRPLITAHRGDSSRFRENTLVAIKSAIDSGADIVEIDIRESKDGEVVVLHDRTLIRLWGYESEVNALTLDEVTSLGFGSNRVPTLKQTLELFVDRPSMLMIDMDTSEHAESALKVVKDSPLSSESIIWCGDVEAMRVIRKGSPEARIWFPWNQPEMPTLDLIKDVRPEYINSHYSYWNREKVAHVHSLGLKTSAWTIDDAPTLRWAKEIGIDSVTSNQLNLTKEIFAEHGEIDPLDLARASELCNSIAQWALMVCQMMEPGKILTKVNPADLVTEVDIFIEHHAREMILANFPTHNIVGEEFGGEFDGERPTWYIDPVDGTTNFANRTPWSSFSLALAVGRDPLVAATIDPWRNKVFTAVKNGGAAINGVPLVAVEVSTSESPLHGRVVLTELAGSRPWSGLIKMLDALNENYCTMRIMGAGTLTLTSVAANYGVGAVVHSFSPIDHLAAALIGKEAGCIVLNEAGEEDLFPLTGGMLIVQPFAREALYSLWSESITRA